MSEQPASGGAELDLDGASRQALGLDEVLAWVAEFARTAAGADRVRSCLPSIDAAEVGERLSRVAELRRHTIDEGALLGAGLPDVRDSLRTVAVEGVTLDGKAARDLALVAAQQRNQKRFEPAPHGVSAVFRRAQYDRTVLTGKPVGALE